MDTYPGASRPGDRQRSVGSCHGPVCDPDYLKRKEGK
jgi:hypothetical protein